KLVVVAVGV
nr:Chain C, MM92 [Schaalia radingae]